MSNFQHINLDERESKFKTQDIKTQYFTYNPQDMKVLLFLCFPFNVSSRETNHAFSQIFARLNFCTTAAGIQVDENYVHRRAMQISKQVSLTQDETFFYISALILLEKTLSSRIILLQWFLS